MTHICNRASSYRLDYLPLHHPLEIWKYGEVTITTFGAHPKSHLLPSVTFSRCRSLSIYLYTRAYTHTHMDVCTFMSIPVSIHVCIFISAPASVSVFLSTSIYVCVLYCMENAIIATELRNDLYKAPAFSIWPRVLLCRTQQLRDCGGALQGLNGWRHKVSHEASTTVMLQLGGNILHCVGQV